METAKNNKKSMCFSRVETEQTVIIPDYKETLPGNDDSFVKYGPFNTFPNELRTLVKESVSASSVINAITEYFSGLEYEFKETANITRERINRDGDTLDDLIEACVRDNATFGGYAIQVIYNKLDEIAELYSIPMEFLRTNESRTRFWFSKKWSKYSSKAVEYKCFEDRTKDDKSCIMMYSNAGRLQVYPITPFTPALYDMYAEATTGKYIAKTLDSGISARYIVSLPNSQNLTDEQKEDIEEGVKAKFTGLENAGEFMLYFNNGDQGLEVEKIESDNSHDIFNNISSAASLRIYQSLHTTPALCGNPSLSSGFNSNEYDESYRLFVKMTLKPIAKDIARGINRIMGIDTIKINID